MLRGLINSLLVLLAWLVAMLLCFAFMVNPAGATTPNEVCAAVAPGFQDQFCGSNSSDCVPWPPALYDGQYAYCGRTVSYQQNGIWGPGYYQSMSASASCSAGVVDVVSVPYYRASGGTAEGGPVTMVPGSIKTLPSSGCYAGCSVDYGSYHLSSNPPVYWRYPYDPAAGPVDVYLHVDATLNGSACSPDAGGDSVADDQPASNISCLIDSATGQCATCALDPATGTCASTQPGSGTTGGSTTDGSTTGGSTTDGSTTDGSTTGGSTTGGSTTGTGTSGTGSGTGTSGTGTGTTGSGNADGWGGTCKNGFTCSGDAVQCAQAQAAWNTACALAPDPADASASAAEAAYSASAPSLGASSVQFSLSSVTDRVIGPNGGCPADLVIGGPLHVVLPLSNYCDVLHKIGLAGNAISMLIAVGIIFGRKASEVV